GPPDVRRRGTRPGNALLGLAGLCGFLALVEPVPRLGFVSPDHLPPPSAIAAALVGEMSDAALWTALGDALTGWARGLSIPPTPAIAGALVGEMSGAAFWTALGDTLTGWALGLFIATTAGITAGLVISVVPYLREATAGTVEFLRPIPSVALIPLAVLLFGTD